MTISMILLWLVVIFEFLLILGLVKRSEDLKKTNEKIQRIVREINIFLDSYTIENQKTHNKTISLLEKIGDKIIEMENGN